MIIAFECILIEKNYLRMLYYTFAQVCFIKTLMKLFS